MCGIVTNIAATPAGRQFLVTNSNGKELLEQFNRLLPVIPAPSGNCLKRYVHVASIICNENITIQRAMWQNEGNPELCILCRLLLMALYNVSINHSGLKFLQQQTDLLAALAHGLKTDDIYELKLMELRLLQALTCDIPNGTVLKDILKHVCEPCTWLFNAIFLQMFSKKIPYLDLIF
jgi:hypothetical protein